MRYARSVADLIGNTPLVQPQSRHRRHRATVLAKVEYFNPGGSSARTASRRTSSTRPSGRAAPKPGGTIVEPTSGNTGVGLALVAQQRGYRCIFVVPDKVAEDKRRGACARTAPRWSSRRPPSSRTTRARTTASRIGSSREIPGAFKPNQYANPNGPRSHYETTGPEIWRDTEGRVTHFVAGVGTGGTITGTGRFLKEASAGSVRIVAVDPVGSIYSGGPVHTYDVEGVGEDFWPAAYDPSVVDEIHRDRATRSRSR